MEPCVSNLETMMADSKTEFKTSQDMILLPLQSAPASGSGGSFGESSKATPANPNLANGTNPNFGPNNRQGLGPNYNPPARTPFLKMEFPDSWKETIP